MKKLKKKIKEIDIKEVYEDAIAASPSNGGASASGASASATLSTPVSNSSGISDTDVLGNCNHETTGGYMKDGCFHLPTKVMKTLRRFDVKKKKHRKHKKQYEYTTKS